jgi:hypothetical protein
MPSLGTNTNISAIGTSLLPAVSNSPVAIGTGTGNCFIVRQTGSADVAATTFLAATAGQFMYVTEIHWSVWGASATPRLINLVAAASALGQQNILALGNGSDSRIFRNPWKTTTATGQILNYAVTSQGAVSGNWELVVHGYYSSS